MKITSGQCFNFQTPGEESTTAMWMIGAAPAAPLTKVILWAGVRNGLDSYLPFTRNT